MFGDLAKSFGRTFLIAHLVPAILFISVKIILVKFGLLALPYWMGWERFGIKYLDEKAIILLLIAFFIASGLQQFNNLIVKMYEGYFIDRLPKRLQVYTFLTSFRKYQKRLYNKRIVEIKQSNERNEGPEGKQFDLTRNFPDLGEILPTRLGNKIRAFEHYAKKIYNIDPITGWTRLVSVIPSSYKEEIEKSQTDFTFFLNLSFLSVILGIEWLILPGELIWRTLLLIPCFCFFVSYLLYRISCMYAEWWGEYVRSAFDLYRYDLLKQMGSSLPSGPITLQEEKAIWSHVQEHTFYVKDPGEPDFSNVGKLKFLPRSAQSKQTKNCDES